MHVAFGFALIGAIVGEYTGADKGLGLLINHSQGNFDAAGIYAGDAHHHRARPGRRVADHPARTPADRLAPAVHPPARSRPLSPPHRHPPPHSQGAHPCAATHRRILAASLAAAAVATRCRLPQQRQRRTTTRPATPKVTIMVGGIDKVIYLPAKLTEQLGYFKDAGVDVELKTEPSGASAENVLLAGQVDGVVGFYDHTITLQAQGKCIESVVQFAKVPGEAEVVSTKAGDDHRRRRLQGQEARRHLARLLDRLPHAVPRHQERHRHRRLHDGHGRRRLDVHRRAIRLR